MGGTAGTRAAVSIASLALIAGGAWAAYSETRPFLATGLTDAERISSFTSGEVLPGPSIASQRNVLENCLRAIIAAGARPQPASRLRSVSENCLAIADGISRTSPSNSYAWYVGSLAAYRLNDHEGSILRLVRSQETGPSEQWIAELRVGLGEAQLAQLPPEARANHDRDLRMLVSSQRGIASIASRYVRVPEFRERITAIVETMPESDQRRFIGTIRNTTDQTVGL